MMQFDGKGVVMIPEALREATAKAAARARRKLRTRLSPGEKNGRKPMAEVAAVYDTLPAPRTPADVITAPGAGSDTTRRRGPKATGKWLTASVTHDIPKVIAAGFDEAQRRDPTGQRTWVVLVDGNRAQTDVYCLGVKNVLGPDVTDELTLSRFLPDYYAAYPPDGRTRRSSSPNTSCSALSPTPAASVSNPPPPSPTPPTTSAYGKDHQPSPSARTANPSTSRVHTTTLARSSKPWNIQSARHPTSTT
ncbi:MAG TPA: hypothetical protein VEO01_26065 [Pseudonocardiaceae bacterium]|nr:hypothetical protein [Pseudonocardiaceae bacterium]